MDSPPLLVVVGHIWRVSYTTRALEIVKNYMNVILYSWLLIL